jgi:hypothetical protein
MTMELVPWTMLDDVPKSATSNLRLVRSSARESPKLAMASESTGKDCIS